MTLTAIDSTFQTTDEDRPAPEASGIAAMDPGLWDGALCAQTDPEAFFPEKGESPREAKRLCNSDCPIKEQCLETAIARNERHGIWGGLSPRERDKIVRDRDEIAREREELLNQERDAA